MSRQFRSDDTQKWTYGFGDGSDGDLTISSNTTDSPITASCSGTVDTTSLSSTNVSFAAGQIIFIWQHSAGTGSPGFYELNKIASYTAGTITTALPLQNTYTLPGVQAGSFVQVIKQNTTASISSGITLTSSAYSYTTLTGGLIAIMAKESITITGTATALGKGYHGGGTGAGGGNPGGVGGSYKDTRPFFGSATAVGNGGAGGTGAGGHGGGGGYATAGGAGSTQGGGVYGDAELTTLVYGGGGGGQGNNGIVGSEGGGGIILIAPEITVTGAMSVRGAGGSSGAGAGGFILMKCVNATLGTNLLLGTGNTGSGGAGGTGRIHIDYSGSITGTTNPTLSSRLDSSIKPAGGGGAFFQFM